jgi:hypothetical protein
MTSQPADEATPELFDNWFDPIERALRDRVRGIIEELIQSELETALASLRDARLSAGCR